MITATKDQLLPSLTAALSATSGKTLPILGCVLIDVANGELKATGSDLESQIVATGQVDKKDSLRVAAPAKKLVDIVRMLPDGASIKLDVKNDKLTVQSGRSRYSLACHSADNFPAFDLRGADIFRAEIDAKLLLGGFRRVRSTAGVNDVRYYLNGVALQFCDGVLRTIASNGHRLSLCEQPTDSESASRLVIVPIFAVSEICKILGNCKGDLVTVTLTEATISIVTSAVTFSSKLIEGRFPDYTRVIPKSFTSSFSVAVREMMDALKRVSIILGDQKTGIALSLSGESATLSTINAESEESSEEVQIEDHAGVDRTLGYSSAYLIDALGTCETESAAISVDANGAMQITETGEKPTWMAVVMPMRL